MALHRIPYFVGSGPDGSPEHPADLMRQVLSDNAGNGVGSTEALAPRADNPASGRVVLASGGVTIQGRAQTFQGAYADFNSGDLFVDVPANTSGGTRYDMVAIRVEDPDFEGNRDRSTDEIIFPTVITGVPSTARTLADAGKPGYSAVPICLVANDGTAINGSDIVDVRELANPRFDFKQESMQKPVGFSQAITQGDGVVDFPSYATITFTVPEWAVEADVVMTHHGLVVDGKDFQVHNLNGTVYAAWDGGFSGTGTSFNVDWTTRFDAFTTASAYTIGVKNIRGQNVTLQAKAEVTFIDASGDDELQVGDTVTTFQVFFREVRSPYTG